MPTLAIYARKSTESEDRQVLSIDSQIKELTDHANRQGLPVSKVFKESKSAKSPGRPVFSDVLDYINKGDIDMVLCWKLDRLARNPVDGAALIWALEEKKLTKILTPQRDFENTGNDKFWMQLEFGMAKKYVDDLSDNVKRGLRAKIEQGWQTGIAPFGYLNDKVNKTIVRDPDRFPILRRMWDMMLTGNYSPPQILERATNDWGLRTRKFKRIGGGPMMRSGVYEMFENPFYCGLIRFNGQIYEGAHEPLVSKQEFEKVRRILEQTSRPRPKKLSFAYRGLLRCGECGASITAENKFKHLKSTGRKKQYVYYHCTKKRTDVMCSQRVVEEADLEKQILGFLSSIHIDAEFAEWAARRLDSFKEAERRQSEAVVVSLKKRLAAAEHELSELTNLRLRSLIEDEEFSRKRTELQREVLSLKNRIESHGQTESEVIQRSREVFDFAATATRKFKNGSPDQKREILSTVGSNRTLLDRKLVISAHKPYEVIKDFVSSPAAKIGMFEPVKIGLDTTRTVPFEDGSCAMLRESDSN